MLEDLFLIFPCVFPEKKNRKKSVVVEACIKIIKVAVVKKIDKENVRIVEENKHLFVLNLIFKEPANNTHTIFNRFYNEAKKRKLQTSRIASVKKLIHISNMIPDPLGL